MRSRTVFDRPRLELSLPRGREFGVAPNAPRRAVINVRVGRFYLLWFATRKEGAGPLKQMPRGKRSGVGRRVEAAMVRSQQSGRLFLEKKNLIHPLFGFGG